MTNEKQEKNYRELTNTLEKKLKKGNVTYFDDLRSYLLTAGIFYNEAVVNQQVYEILVDILEAQKNGEIAEDYFGKNPQQVGNELIKNFPKENAKKKLTFSLYIMCAFWVFQLVSDLAKPGLLQLNILSYLVTGLLSILVVQFIFFLVHRSIYLKPTNPLRKNKIVGFIFLWVIATIVLAGYIGIWMKMPKVLMLPIPYPIDIVLILALVGGISFVVMKEKMREFYPILLFITVLGGIGLISRFPMTAHLLSGKNGSMIILGIIIVTYIIYLFFSNRQMKKFKKTK